MILLAPRGELSPGAFALKSSKKRTFLRWWGPFLRRMDVRWHASTEDEAAHIRALFPWASIEIALDQVCLPDEPLPATPGADGPARLVFISRISPKKNLDLALAALKGVRKPVEFDVYGPAEDPRYMARCRAAMEQLPPHVRARYLGELPTEQVRQTFSRYDAFVFPTRGENFGHVIGESLSASCPVVCSDETPWSPVLTAGGGTVIEPLTVAGLLSEIERIASMTPTHRLAARRLAGTAYRRWRAGVDGRNILDDLRLRSAVAATSMRDRATAHGRALDRPSDEQGQLVD
jgi:glycosyltransferase involved in cell wall biosynthesis